jgi:hypothetical protein
VICLIRGPILLIVLGSLFAIDQFTPYGFWRTWPVLVILFGLLKLLERLVERDRQAQQSVPPGGSS